MKTCPYCVAEIPNEAQKCRHCGEWVVPPPGGGNAPARVEVTLARRKPTWADRLGIGCAVAILLAIVLGLGAEPSLRLPHFLRSWPTRWLIGFAGWRHNAAFDQAAEGKK